MAEIKKLTDLSPDSHNANKGTAKGLKMLDDSLRKNGAGRSILIDRAGRIIAGNKTHQAAVDIGLEDVIIVKTTGDKLVAVQREDLDLDDPTTGARELAYRDNVVSYWDFSLDPAVVMADMESGFDFEAIGVSLDELGEMLEGSVAELLGGGNGEVKDAPPQIDKAKELQAKWGTELGQVWELGDHRLVIGDCTDPAVVEAVMRGEKAGISFTDPPYNVGVAIGDATNDSRLKGDFVEWCKRWLQFTPDKLLMTVGIKNLLWWDEIIGPPQWVIAWVKRNGQGQTGLMGTNKWDPILVYGVEPDNNIDIIEINNDYSDRIKGDGIHPTSKPVELWVKILDRFSSPFEIVYEPFLGTGTTLLACENLKQKCRACEIEPSYAAVTIQRWTDLTSRDPIRVSG